MNQGESSGAVSRQHRWQPGGAMLCLVRLSGVLTPHLIWLTINYQHCRYQQSTNPDRVDQNLDLLQEDSQTQNVVLDCQKMFHFSLSIVYVSRQSNRQSRQSE